MFSLHLFDLKNLIVVILSLRNIWRDIYEKQV
jgi:hypothetical protein